MLAHITSHCLISPQETFYPERFLLPVRESDEPFLTCLDPDFKTYIPPVQLRRISHLLKRSLTAGGLCVEHAQASPDAIIVGSGRACANDLNLFLRGVVQPRSEGVSPIGFINSSHNTVAAQMALKTGNTGYNTTYCHRGFSFESALMDAMMLLSEGKAERVLTGGLDEFSSTSFRWDGTSGIWKTQKINSLNLLHSGTPGTICGEGTAFFMLQKELTPQVKATLRCVSMRFGQDFGSAQEKMMYECRKQTSEELANIDAVLLGRNGDCRMDPVYDHFLQHHTPAGRIGSGV